MTKRSIFLALGTALALVVLTAGLAFASGRWDGHHPSGRAVSHQVSTSIQPTTQQPGGSVRSTGPRTGHGWCDQAGTRARMATKTATGYATCTTRTSNHRSTSVHNVQATTRPTATTTARSSSQPRSSSSRSQWMDRHGSRDRDCWDSWR